MKAALHPQEENRLAALARYEIVDTPVEPEFDEIARLVGAICETPIAVVNLIADGRQFFKSEIGIGVREMPLEPSICAHAILSKDLMVVPDTLDDERFIDNPLVIGEPGLRFYAGALLKSDDGYPIGTLCVLDVEPRKLSEHQLSGLQILARHVMHLLEMRQARRREAVLKQRVQRALDAHKRLVKIVIHDLRNPLNTIKLTAEYLKTFDGQALQDIAARIERMNDQMVALVDDLQNYDSLREGRVALELQPVHPHELLKGVEAAFALTAEEAGIGLRLKRDQTAPQVLADPRRCQQLLDNLVQNALKFTPRGGCVEVSVQSVEARVRFAVADNGCGIERDELENLFTPHWRSDSVQDKPGVGLGLSIVQMLARAHGTDIRVQSRPGVGSTFSFELPVAAD